MSTQPEVKKGQIWADNDHRMAGRTLAVISVINGGGDPYAVCEVLTNDTMTQNDIDSGALSARTSAQRDRRGKTTMIKVRRFKPTSTGYRLIKDVD